MLLQWPLAIMIEACGCQQTEVIWDAEQACMKASDTRPGDNTCAQVCV